MFNYHKFSICFVFIALSTAAQAASTGQLDHLAKAQSAYNRTDYRSAIESLSSTSVKPIESNFLLGKSYYMLGDFKKACDFLHKSAELDGNNSDLYLWLGRAYGRRAESSNPLTAPSYATKARQNFEKSVNLNPKNGDALSDLFDYYLQAPGFLGGGLEKAVALLPKIKDHDSAEFHFAQAQLAEKRKEFATAEQQLRRALDLAPRQVGRVIDLAKFLLRRGRIPESDALWKQAATIAPNDPKVLFEQANALIASKRDLTEAKRLLKLYLQAPLTPELPSRSEAAKLLKQAENGA